MSEIVKQSNMVGFKLMDGADMGDILDIILDDNEQCDAELMPGGFWEVDCDGELVVDLRKISETLERPFDEKDFLQYVSSFYGRVSVEHEQIRLISEILMVSDYETHDPKKAAK